MTLSTHKYLVAWAKASGFRVTGIATEYYSLSGRPVAVVILGNEDGTKTRSVCACDAYNLWWGPNAVDYGYPHHRTEYMKRLKKEREEYLARKA